MLVEFGNPAPTRTENAPAVTYINVPDSYTYVVADSAADLAQEAAVEIATAPDGITRLPDQEALLTVQAVWRMESRANPTWVWSDNDNFAVLLGKFFNCSVGRPDDTEATYFTNAGEPGVGPEDAIVTEPAVDPFPAPEEPGEPEATA